MVSEQAGRLTKVEEVSGPGRWERRRQITRLARKVLPVYGVMLGGVGAALFGTVLVPPLREQGSLPLFLLVVALSSYYGGQGCGLAATGLSLAALEWFVLPRGGPAVAGAAEHLSRLTVFLVAALLIGSVGSGGKRAEARFRRYRNLAEHGLGLICIHDLEGTVLWMNHASIRLLGYPPEELLGRSLRDVLAPAVQHLFDEYLQRIRRNGSDSGLMRVMTRRGECLVWRYHNRLFQEPDTEPCVLGTAQDVTELQAAQRELKKARNELERRVAERTADLVRATERMQAEFAERMRAQDALRESEARYRTLVETAPDGILVEVDARIAFVNPICAELLGAAPEELRGSPVSSAFPAGSWERVQQQRACGEERHSVRWAEETLMRVDGTVVPVEIAARPVSYQGKSANLIIIRDITARKLAEAALRASESRYRELFENANALVYTHDLEGNITSFNRAAERLTGYSREQAVRMNVAQLLAPESAPLYRKLCGEGPRAEALPAFEVELRRRDGGRFPVEVNLRILRLENAAEVQVIATDSTERKAAEAAILERARLAALSAEVGLALTHSKTLHEGLQRSAQALVRYLDAACACIWTPNALNGILELQASAGLHPGSDGGSSPIGRFEAGLIAQTRHPYWTNSVAGDACIPEQDWARENGIVAFAGYPLLIDDRVAGVAAVFSQRPWTEATLQAMAALSHQVSLGIQRKRAEEERSLLAAIVESSSDAIISRTMDGTVLTWNRGAEQLLGYSAGEMLGRSIWTQVPPERREELRAAEEKVMRGEPVPPFETVRVRKDGSLVDVSVSISPIKDEWDRIVGISAVSRDISERKRSEEALRQLSGRLLRVQDEERRRIARELHDTTAQNLAALEMNLSIMRRSAKNLDAKSERRLVESLQLARQCSRELRSVSYLLHPPWLDELGLAAVLAAYVQGYEQRTGVRVRLELPPSYERLPREHELALFRVVQESLVNVHRHSGSSEATVQMRDQDGAVVLEIRDYGKGMALETLEQAGGLAGLGVGILGMRERMQQLGGRLEIVAAHPGTHVRAVLPRGRPAAAGQAVAVAARQAG